MKTLKQAILKLPEIDKRWKHGGTLGHESYYYFKRKSYKTGATISTVGNSIETYHAAALTLGYEIKWDTATRNGVAVYFGAWAETGSCNMSDGWTCTSDTKFPAKAIEAAFIAAVNDAWE